MNVVEPLLGTPLCLNTWAGPFNLIAYLWDMIGVREPPILFCMKCQGIKDQVQETIHRPAVPAWYNTRVSCLQTHGPRPVSRPMERRDGSQLQRQGSGPDLDITLPTSNQNQVSLA